MSGAVLSLLGTAGGGSSAVTIALTGQNLFAAAPGTTATITYQINADGKVYYTQNGGSPVFLEDWCIPASQAANYECYATVIAGALNGGSAATNTWIALSSSRTWLITRTTLGLEEAAINVGIRRVGSVPILASADIYLYAEYV